MDTAELFSLKGRVALVTGASSGLGRRFAQVAAANGARVVLTARRRDRLEALKTEIEGAGGTALVAAADVTDRAALDSVFAAAEVQFGTVDLFVANAGIGVRAYPSEVDEAGWRADIDVDLGSAFFSCQSAAQRMVAAGRPGSIVAIASIAGLRTATRLAPYAIAKAGLIHAMKMMAHEFGPMGVRVNTIAPGWVMTEMANDFLTSPDGIAFVKTLPLGRHGQPADLDGAFLLLASDAGRFITGVTLPVDGGNMLMS